jgi:hypothetical protein
VRSVWVFTEGTWAITSIGHSSREVYVQK